MWLIGWLESQLARRAGPPRRGPYVCPPTDWSDGTGWDRYWEPAITYARKLAAYAPPPREEVTPDGLATLASSNWDLRPIGDALYVWGVLDACAEPGEVLVVGNGISLLPRALAHLGWRVTVLDVSPAAVEFSREYQPLPSELHAFFLDRSHTPPRYCPASEVARSAGTTTYVLGDVLDPSTVGGPFDVIVSHRSIQGYSGAHMREVVARLDSRLAPDGTIRCGIQNDGEVCSEVSELFRQLGYRVNDESPEPGKRLEIGLFSG